MDMSVDGNMNPFKYVPILTNHVHPYIRFSPEHNGIFQHDNVTSPTVGIVREELEEHRLLPLPTKFLGFKSQLYICGITFH